MLEEVETKATSSSPPAAAPAVPTAPEGPIRTAEAALHARLQALAGLRARMQALRPLPARLLQLQPPGPAQVHARQAFRAIDDARALLTGADVQDALRAARESARADPAGITRDRAREGAEKKRRMTVSESPSPFASFHTKTTSTFPPLRGDVKATLTARDLPAYVREHNERSNNTTKVHIWVQKRSKASRSRPYVLSNPAVVRVTIQDVMTVFVKLTYGDAERDALMVESVAAFGPREKAGPYGYSEYAVYQKLSQQMVGMVESEPKVTLGQLVEMLSSYDGLFMRRCSACGRVLSQEGHIPPVGRVWRESEGGKENEGGRWDARHISCLQT